MTAKTRTIEVDEATAATLQRRADAQGLSVAALVAGMTALQGAPVVLPHEELAELDRQWDAIVAGRETTVPHDEVARWLETWGTPAYKPWPVR